MKTSGSTRRKDRARGRTAAIDTARLESWLVAGLDDLTPSSKRDVVPSAAVISAQASKGARAAREGVIEPQESKNRTTRNESAACADATTPAVAARLPALPAADRMRSVLGRMGQLVAALRVSLEGERAQLEEELAAAIAEAKGLVPAISNDSGQRHVAGSEQRILELQREHIASQGDSELPIDERGESPLVRLREELQAAQRARAEELAASLAPLEGLSFSTVEESRAFVSELNGALEMAGCRLAEPASGRAATLFVLKPSGAPPGGYLAFKILVKDEGRKDKSRVYRGIPPLRVIAR